MMMAIIKKTKKKLVKTYKLEPSYIAGGNAK